MAEENELPQDFQGLEPVRDVKLGTSMGIATIALNMALRYHDINTVQDGALYQQYKLEGKNFRELHLDHVFETAMKMELHLLTAERRVAQMIVDMVGQVINDVINEDETEQEAPLEEPPLTSGT